MKIDKYKKIFILLIMLIILFIPISYSYFDNLTNAKHIEIKIGEWISYDDEITPEILLEYLESYDTIIITLPNGQVVDIREYLYSLLFVMDNNGYSDTSNIQDIYQNYTIKEMITTIDLIIEFIEHFLIIDNNNLAEYPSAEDVDFITLNLSNGLLPGEFIHINQILQTANLTNFILDQLIIIITIEAPKNEDISDFAVDLLFDSSVFSKITPFNYQYYIIDESEDIIVFRHINKTINDLLEIDDNVEFYTYSYKEINESYIPTTLKQIYDKPLFTGSWSRLPIGPNYYLQAPDEKYSNERFIKDNPPTSEGLLLLGRSDGNISEVRLLISQPNSPTDEMVTAIPFILSISRGLEMDESHPHSIQKTIPIKPIIKIKVIRRLS